MAAHREEITLEFRNLPADSTPYSASRRYRDQDVEVAPVVSGKLLRWIAVSFGLLCILQTAVNISLRIVNTSQLNSLSKERDEENRMLNDCVSELNFLTEERDKLKRKLTNIVNSLNQGWLYYQGSLYYISRSKKNWQASRNFCMDTGAQLVIIDSKREHEFIRSLQLKVWIGLSDIETEGVWKWVDGTPLTQSFWNSGEPNNAAGLEDCVETVYYMEGNRWNDLRCSRENYWICERKMDK